MPWDAISAIGSVLGGLAIVLAFVQLGGQRQDQLRAQVSKIGAWTGKAERLNAQRWKIPLSIRNSSELPVFAEDVEILASPTPAPYTTLLNFEVEETIIPGTIWQGAYEYPEDPSGPAPDQPTALIQKLILTDAAGRKWEISPFSSGGAPKYLGRVRRSWRRLTQTGKPGGLRAKQVS